MKAKKLVHLLALLLIVILLETNIVPVRAEPSPQLGMQTFTKPEWQLTMKYPATWTVENQTDFVRFLTGDGVTDLAALAVLSDPAYADDTLDLEQLLSDSLVKLGAGLTNYTLGPLDDRLIGGVPARGISISGISLPSYAPIAGFMFHLVKGDRGYLIVGAAPQTTFQFHVADFNAMLDSAAVGQVVRPTRTPRATPTRPKRQPTPTPTEEAVEPTEEAAPTEEVMPTEEVAPTEEVMPTEEAAPTEEVMPTEGAAPPVTTTGTVTPTLQPVTALTVTSTATVTTTGAVTKTPVAAIITSTVTVTATAEVTASLSALTATQAFTSDAWGISLMSYPAAWTTSTQGETSTIFAEDLALFDAGDFSSAGAARLTVLNRKQALAGTNLRDVMAKEAAKAWKLSALPDVKKAKAVKLGGKTALELQANAQLADGGAVKTWNRIALVGDNVVIISAIAPAQASSQYETLFANLFNSVKFVK